MLLWYYVVNFGVAKHRLTLPSFFCTGVPRWIGTSSSKCSTR